MHKTSSSEKINAEAPHLPMDVWKYCISFLSTESFVKLSGVNKFFKQIRDQNSLYPIYPIWRSFYSRVLKNNCLIDTSKINMEVEREFCRLIKKFILDRLSGKNYNISNYLNEKIMGYLFDITQDSHHDIEHIKKLHENPATSWSELNSCHYRNDPEPTQEELLALFIYNFRRAFNQPAEERDDKNLILAGEKLLHHILLGTDFETCLPSHLRYERSAHFNFLSFSNINLLVKFLPREKSELLLSSLQMINSSHCDENRTEIFNMYILGRCFQYLFNEKFNNDKYVLAVRNLINSELHKIFTPHFPTICNRDFNGFQIRFNFSTSSALNWAKEKFEKMGLTFKSGKIGKEFAVEINSIEPTELFLLLNKNGAKNANEKYLK